MPSPTSSGPTASINPSTNSNINSLLAPSRWGDTIGTTAISYSFPFPGSFWSTDTTGGYGASTGDGEPWNGFDGLKASDIANFTDALTRWSAVANIGFFEVADTADNVGEIRAAYTTESDYAHAYHPNSSPRGGDIWFDVVEKYGSFVDTTPGTYEFATYLHEIGHAIGFKHPFEGPHFLDFDLDAAPLTVMSYSIAPGVSAASAEVSHHPTTPMPLDIDAIQYIYGPNMNYHVGDNTYTYFEGGSYFETIWDAGGSDTIEYISATGGEIDLRAGYWNEMGNPIEYVDGAGDRWIYRKTINIYRTVVIENAFGGEGADTIIGNGAGNFLVGNGGDDIINSLAGNDRIFGGFGSDRIYGGDGNDIINGQAGADIIDGQDGNDTISGAYGYDILRGLDGADLLSGGAGDDFLHGGAGPDVLSGNAGDDRLAGGPGFDRLEGGFGNDTYILDNPNEIDKAVIDGGIDHVISSVGYVLGAEQEYVTLLGGGNINAVGNSSANEIIGNDGRNLLFGGPGNDMVEAGGGDDDLRGGFGNDLLFGDHGDDVLYGQSGNDSLNGGGNDDYLEGAYGNDELRGGSGSDMLLGGPDNDFLAGEAGSDILNGGNGFDILEGGAGNDSLFGGFGNDVLNGGAGVDELNGLAGNDLLVFDIEDNYKVAGNSGTDTLYFTGSGQVLDLTAISNSRYQGIEKINLSGSGANSLFLDINDVLSLPDLDHSFVTGAWTEILVDGDGDEFVQSTGQGWSYLGTAVVDSATYDYYGHFGLNAGLLVDDNITAQIIN